jgi:hypothetical protein
MISSNIWELSPSWLYIFLIFICLALLIMCGSDWTNKPTSDWVTSWRRGCMICSSDKPSAGAIYQRAENVQNIRNSLKLLGLC